MKTGVLGSRRAIAVVASLVLMSACGSSINYMELGPARPHGADGRMIVNGRHISGELLAVSDTAFVLQTRDGIVLVPKLAIDESNFRDLDVHRGSELAGDILERHRLMSRFPMGMTPEVLRSLLRQSGQSELKVIGP
jgi:hypothetical protein